MEERLQFVRDAVSDRFTMSELCARFGVSRRISRGGGRHHSPGDAALLRRPPALSRSARGEHPLAVGVAGTGRLGSRGHRRQSCGDVQAGAPSPAAQRRPRRRVAGAAGPCRPETPPPGHTHRRPTAQQHLEILKARDQLVRTRTQLINHVRSVVKVSGARLRATSAAAFVARAAPEIPPELRGALEPVAQIIADRNRQIREADQQISRLIHDVYPVAERLQQISGVGPLTALAFVLLVDEPARFDTSRDVGAYFGLVPRLDESSDSQPQLRISKCGDALGRRLLVTAAHYILGPFGPDCDLRRHGLAIAERGGKNAKKRGVVAVARKLAVLLHRLWVSDRPYDPDFIQKLRPRTTGAPMPH